MRGIRRRGRLIYIMGPSGAGKDTLLSALRGHVHGLPLAFVRRYITRPAGTGAERHIPISRERFEELAATGRFSLQWTSHGYRYGIPSAWDHLLESGISLLVNGSRAAFPQARQRYPDILPVLITANPALLRARLLARGRESLAEREERLRDAFLPIPEEVSVTQWIHIENSGLLQDAVLNLATALKTVLVPDKEQ